MNAGRTVALAGLLLALATRVPEPAGWPALASGAWALAGVAYQRSDGAGVAHLAGIAGRLDRSRSVPWVYGAVMARRLGAAGDAERLLAEGADARPHDPTIPAMLGAIRWADHGDAAGAASWYRRAASIPGASPDLAVISAALSEP